MKKSKAYAVCFTLLFFGSFTQTTYLVFSDSSAILVLLALLFNVGLLVLAIRYWRISFRKDN